MNTVSVIIPGYNQGRFLAAAVKSLINQTHSEWECIIIDDGSTDNTSAVSAELCSLDTRVKYYYKKNGGVSSARNEGLKKVRGAFIQFLDADDFIAKNKIEKSLQIFEADPACSLVITDFVRCTADDNYRTPPYCDLTKVAFNFESILLEWDKSFTIPIHCGLFKTELLNGYQFEENIGAKEDWLMWLQIFLSSPKVSFINLPLAVYREHEKSASFDRLFIHEDTVKAFGYIMHNILDDKYGPRFFDKVNNYWLGEIKLMLAKVAEYQNVQQTILESPTFMVGRTLLYPANALRRLIRSFINVLR